ncbi:hypothetical protein ACHQM5_013324 [Ranunculus cassubicifolius]
MGMDGVLFTTNSRCYLFSMYLLSYIVFSTTPFFSSSLQAVHSFQVFSAESMVAMGAGCKWDQEIKGSPWGWMGFYSRLIQGCTHSPGILRMESMVATGGGCKWDKEIKGFEGGRFKTMEIKGGRFHKVIQFFLVGNSGADDITRWRNVWETDTVSSEFLFNIFILLLMFGSSDSIAFSLLRICSFACKKYINWNPSSPLGYAVVFYPGNLSLTDTVDGFDAREEIQLSIDQIIVTNYPVVLGD